MPLHDDAVQQAFQRYRREFDCYEKLARVVAQKCEREIIRANTLRASVSYRAKGPSKVLEKIQKKYRNLPELNTAEEALSRVTDLAGVRISTYLESDRARVVEAIEKLFVGPDGGAVHVDRKDQDAHFYRATHCQVSLRPEDMVETLENVEGLACEIQVCSLLAHVWNELEHDLVYKPATGNLSTREEDSLSILGNLTLSGDVVIRQLFEANAERLRQAQGHASAFQDVYDFVARTRDFFPNAASFGRNAGQLFEDLAQLGIDSPTKIKDQLLSDQYEERSQTLLGDLQGHLRSVNDDAVDVEPDTSDALLVLLLDAKLDSVLKLHPMGRGRGRPPRIASFASRFKQMKDGG